MKNLVIFCVLFISISYSAQVKTNFPPKEFFACWKASYEENDDKLNLQAFRSCSYANFPPSMFRLEIEFFSDGKCKYLHVGATDAHYFVEGKWTYNKKTKVISVTDDKGKMEYKFKIKEVKQDTLKISSLL